MTKFDVLRGVQLRVVENMNTWSLDLYLYAEQGNRIMVVEPVEFILTEVDESKEDKVEPTIRLDRKQGHMFMKQFVEELEKEGVKTDKQTKAEAELNVTKSWLEDMRTLVFKDVEK